MLIKIVTIFSAVSFLYYGSICLSSKWMMLEFERFGLSPVQRIITGVFQLLGGIGLLIGLKQPQVGLIASSGLALLMFLGFLTRLKIRDSLTQSFPSIFYMILNAFLAFAYSDYLKMGMENQ